MADIDYQDYRLRCHTKRTDLPVDVLRDIGEAYAEIMRLKLERDAARREVCREESYRPSPSPPCTASQVADRRGWDCFKRTPMTETKRRTPMTDTTPKFDPIPRLQQIAATIEESGADIFDDRLSMCKTR